MHSFTRELVQTVPGHTSRIWLILTRGGSLSTPRINCSMPSTFAQHITVTCPQNEGKIQLEQRQDSICIKFQHSSAWQKKASLPVLWPASSLHTSLLHSGRNPECPHDRWRTSDGEGKGRKAFTWHCVDSLTLHFVTVQWLLQIPLFEPASEMGPSWFQL